MTVPEEFELRTILPELPPLFFMVIEEGLTVSLHPPEPLPVTGGPAEPVVDKSQSNVLTCVPVPATTVTGAIPAELLTVA